jgi:queuine tRNA-ribosyltransferase
MYDMTRHLNAVLPFDKPRYLMGVGAPEDLVENVINGVDMFDCVLPTRNARHATAFTTLGKITIKNKTFERDMTPLDPNLETSISKYSKSYIRHLFKAEEQLAQRLVTIQNLAYLKHLMKEIREAIKADRLLDFKNEFYQRTNYSKVSY